MKKLFFITALVFATCTVASAQDASPFNYGVKVGMNTASISNLSDGIPGASESSVIGFNAGLMGQYMLNKQMGLESGLYYSTMGGKYTAPITGVSAEVKATPAYLQLPITFLYKFDLGNALTLYPDLGIYAGYGLGGNVDVTSNIGDISATGSVKYFGTGESDMNAKKFDFGTTFGLNLQYTKFVLGVGYDLGLTKLNSDDNSGGKDSYNRNLRVTLGYFFK